MTTTDRGRTCRKTDPHTPHGWKATLEAGTRFRVQCPGVPEPTPHYATVHPHTRMVDWLVSPGVYEKRPSHWYVWRCSAGCTCPGMWSHLDHAQSMARDHMGFRP